MNCIENANRDVQCMQNMQSNLMSVKCLWMLPLLLLLLLMMSDSECIHSIQSARCKCQKCRQVNHLIHLSISGQWTGSKQCLAECIGETNCELSSMVNWIALASLWTQASGRVGSLATGQFPIFQWRLFEHCKNFYFVFASLDKLLFYIEIFEHLKCVHIYFRKRNFEFIAKRKA